MSKVKIYPAEGNGVHIRSIVAMNEKIEELENTAVTSDNAMQIVKVTEFPENPDPDTLYIKVV